MGRSEPTDPVLIGIVTGVQAEADALFVGQGTAESQGALSIRTVADSGVVIACAGIGKVSATLAATWLAERYGVTTLMVVGTAGALRPCHGPHWLSGAIQHDFGARRADGFVRYTAGSWPIGEAQLETFAALPKPIGLELPQAIIASGDAFIECGTHAAEIATSLGASLIDMETAAVAQVAAMLGLPWCGIKGPTDDANGDSAGDFQANLAAAARASADAAERAMSLMKRC